MKKENLDNGIKPDVKRSFLPTDKANWNSNVLICNNCKEYWIAPKTKCDCGSTTLTEIHFGNAKLAKNYV